MQTKPHLHGRHRTSANRVRQNPLNLHIAHRPVTKLHTLRRTSLINSTGEIAMLAILLTTLRQPTAHRRHRPTSLARSLINRRASTHSLDNARLRFQHGRPFRIERLTPSRASERHKHGAHAKLATERVVGRRRRLTTLPPLWRPS